MIDLGKRKPFRRGKAELSIIKAIYQIETRSTSWQSLLKVWPDRQDIKFMTPNQFNKMLQKLEEERCLGNK